MIVGQLQRTASGARLETWDETGGELTAEIGSDGDTLLIEPGIYREWGIELPPREIVVTGSAPLDSVVVAATVIDGRREGIVFELQESSDRLRRFRGITITGGSGDDGGGIVCRGGAGLAVEWCAVVGNESRGSGGGLFSNGDSTTVSNTLFADNWAAIDGGAAHLSGRSAGMDLNRCVFVRNSSDGNGGALALPEEPARLTVSSCVFAGNRAMNNGGALYAMRRLDVLVTDCRFLGLR